MSSGRTARVSQIVLAGADIPTPNYIAISQRGMIPHLIPDSTPSAPVAAVYAEHFWDSQGPIIPALQGLPRPGKITICGIRDPLTNTDVGSGKRAKANTDSSLVIESRHGRHLAEVSDLSRAMASVEPDLMILPFDEPSQLREPGKSRKVKMLQRSEEWARKFLAERESVNGKWKFLQSLNLPSTIDEVVGTYSKHVETGSTEKLQISSQVPNDIIDMIKQVAKGTDLVYAPLHVYTDAGLYLTVDFDNCSFPRLYQDLNDDEYIGSMTTVEDSEYSLGYVHHLLECREMTAYVILQKHNLSVLDKLFNDIRKSIASGDFENQLSRFIAKYT